MVNKIKNFILLILISIIAVLILSACEAGRKTEMSEEQDVIIAGDRIVLEDEVRYYFYNTQATYEAYYMAENIELDWNREMSDGITLAMGVKSSILDSICEREAIVSCADQYGIALTAEERNAVEAKVETFFTQTDENLQNLIHITSYRLQEVFEKDELYRKVKAKINVDQNDLSDEMYKNWKTTNTVTTNDTWEKLDFSKKIFD